LERALEQHADLEHEIERGTTELPQQRHLLRTAIWLGITAVSLYLVAPSIVSVLGSWSDLKGIAPAWLAGMAALEAAALACLWVLQRETLRVKAWTAVITSQLAANAVSKVAPGGGAVGAAMQYRMLVQAGLDRTRVAGALTIANLMTLAVVLAMPVLAVPAVVRGLVPGDLLNVTLTGIGLFAVLAAAGATCLATDRPLAWVGRTVQRVRNRLRRRAEPLTGLPTRLLRERDRILATLGDGWHRALLATVGRWSFDYATLLAALAAVGSRPRAALVLLAFCAAQLLSQIPVTPGGLGFVEAGLTAMLTLAGVSAGSAVLATFAYRLFSYWLPLPAGLVAYVVHRLRYGEAT
jgi:putative heme transporter